VVDVERIRPRFRRDPSPDALAAIAIDREAHLALWREFLPLLAAIPFDDDGSAGLRYRFRNPAFSYGDGSVLYAMLRRFCPRRVVEVGSGWSSACAVDTAERYLPHAVEFTFVDPHPELLKELLGDHAGSYSIHATEVQDVPLEVFRALQAGDFLFIDSTHVVKTGSDVCHLLFEVLPRLELGVFVHFHDVFWPFEYGREWVLEQNRSWNEIYALRAFLMFNDAFRIRFFNDYFVHHFRDVVAKDYPTLLKNSGGSLWLEKVL
jgi:hypothetical protein